MRRNTGAALNDERDDNVIADTAGIGGGIDDAGASATVAAILNPGVRTGATPAVAARDSFGAAAPASHERCRKKLRKN